MTTAPAHALTNADIANRLTTLARLLAAQKENAFRVKAYLKAARTIREMGESVEALVREDADLTAYPGIGDAIAGAISEIVRTGTLSKLEKMRADASPELLELSAYPRLDPQQVLRAYKKLRISNVAELRDKLESGALESALGTRLAQHIRQGLSESHAMLLYRADSFCESVESFLLTRCGARRVKAAGNYRRRVEVVDELVFVVEAQEFPSVVSKFEHYGGHTALVTFETRSARFAHSSGMGIRLEAASHEDWGTRLVECTGSAAHLQKLGAFHEVLAPDEDQLYRRLNLAFIPPEIREGRDEVSLARAGHLPKLVTVADVRGDLHAHSTASDGSNTIEQMAAAARARGYEYIGITDHSRSLKIAGGVSIEDLRRQLRYIDNLNAKLKDIRVLKSSEVDILADGSLDYPDEILRELDYTVCSIHSRFGLGKNEQTERIMRAMDNPYFSVLGHATGRLLLKRPGYEIDIDRLVEHARKKDRGFEINCSPDRLDLSAQNARLAREAGVRIVISTDAHSTRELGLIRYGVEQARRAGFETREIGNCLPWK